MRVAPRVGAWIEIRGARGAPQTHVVAPRVGAWIEIRTVVDDCPNLRRSHPVWVRGLKYAVEAMRSGQLTVAPRVGAWIEIESGWVNRVDVAGRTPCGCVD